MPPCEALLLDDARARPARGGAVPTDNPMAAHEAPSGRLRARSTGPGHAVGMSSSVTVVRSALAPRAALVLGSLPLRQELDARKPAVARSGSTRPGCQAHREARSPGARRGVRGVAAVGVLREWPGGQPLGPGRCPSPPRARRPIDPRNRTRGPPHGREVVPRRRGLRCPSARILERSPSSVARVQLRFRLRMCRRTPREGALRSPPVAVPPRPARAAMESVPGPLLPAAHRVLP